jgi:cytidylate kinase
MKKLYQMIQDNVLPSIFHEKEPLLRGPLPIITISREMGSGGKAIANLVAKRLGKNWKVYDQEIIDEIAKEAHLEKKLVKSIDEKRLPLADELISEIFGRRFMNMSGYYKHLIKVLSLIGQRGHAIILGRGANFIFPQALKIRIICEMSQRVTWEMTYEGISRGEAVKRIDNSDEERKSFVQTLFNHDQRKAHHYDMVIRTGPNLMIEDATDLIAELTKRRFRI